MAREPEYDLLVGVVRDYPDGRGRRFTRQPDGTPKVEFVRIVDQLDDSHPIPSLWPEYLSEFFGQARRG